jgi:Cd2+/Zn2+-exporting ATPase
MGMTAVLVSEGKKVIGIIGITDELRDDSKSVIDALKKLKVTPIMLTGDNQRAANYIAEEVGISEAYGALLPEQKSELIEKLQARYQRVAMVGDGVNDAPSLARADVGIAMGGGGSDVAIETADVTLMNDAIGTIPYLLGVGQQTFRVVRQNVYGSLIVKGVILVLGIAGVIGLSVAVAADAIMAVLVVLNGLRLFNAGGSQVAIIKK